MSAREKIIGMMAGDSEGSLRVVAGRVADEILAEHAHELASRIRTHSERDDLDYYSPQGMWEAANLIDPEVDG
ncbi:hypothetical protein OTB20_08480 [Streptomyces sp. H27-H1]|uniref:hypothetical protein n=1 Tax=Streptomyces sp. H27-H1 TaxID=2996461 RepID=UPI002271FB38|nr:hypothetical protein [Streptomyces sp. H27-H1]MCY0926241.1 hypothetical protein [Streptomyces sp. H27-H1]